MNEDPPAVKLTLVIPCYNEAANLPALVERCRPLVENPDIDVLLVDNGSTDATADILPRLLAREERIASLRVEVNSGYGAGILAGLRAANGDVLAWTHADLQTDPADAAIAFAMFRSDGDHRLFVKGRRRGRPLLDNLFTGGMSLFETVLMRRAMRDINAQPTMFGRELMNGWHDAPGDFSLDLYAYWQAKRRRWTIRRIPVIFGPRLFGESHWNTGMKARIKFVKRTLAYSFRLRRQLGTAPRSPR